METNNNRTYRFAGQEIEAPVNLTPDVVQKAWADVFPGLENASIQENEDGSVDFITRAGTKG